MTHDNDTPGVSRRGFLVKAGIPAVAAAAGVSAARPAAAAPGVADPTLPAPLQPGAAKAGPHDVPIALNVNGELRRLTVEPRVTLLDALRERLHLTGSKKGCGQGTCGACTVLIDGRRVVSCLTLAIMHQDDRITTIEGLASGDTLHPMQAAFLEHDGFQCGYCTPGQIMSAVGFIGEKRGLDEATIRESMSGNICRCGAYPNIVSAIAEAGKQLS